jgi:hypothetical protein
VAVIDPNDDDADEGALDFSGVDCPRCGCNDVRILQRPTIGTWWSSGQAQCNYCGHKFALTLEPIADDPVPFVGGKPELHEEWLRNAWGRRK